jgi:hypothetical protein
MSLEVRTFETACLHSELKLSLNRFKCVIWSQEIRMSGRGQVDNAAAADLLARR